MTLFHWVLLIGFGICFISCLYQFLRIVIPGIPKDYSNQQGSPRKAITYSFTKAMSPRKKETAYLHLPTYITGLVFHIGTFLSFFWLVVNFFNINTITWLRYFSFALLIISGISGLSILLKRILSSKLRNLSNPDDYISNIFVSLLHIFSAISMIWSFLLPFLFIYSSLLFVYIPIGKLRHVVYFFTSRFHLALFYGKRNVWPPKSNL